VLFIRWFKHITDAAATYKSKDDGHGHKQPGLVQSSDGDSRASASGPALDTSSSSADVTSPITPSFEL